MQIFSKSRQILRNRAYQPSKPTTSLQRRCDVVTTLLRRGVFAGKAHKEEEVSDKKQCSTNTITDIQKLSTFQRAVGNLLKSLREIPTLLSERTPFQKRLMFRKANRKLQTLTPLSRMIKRLPGVSI